MYVPKSQKCKKMCHVVSIFLCFWDLVANNLRVKCWWNWHHFSPHNSFFHTLFLFFHLLSICLSLSFNAKYSFLLYLPHPTTLCLDSKYVCYPLDLVNKFRKNVFFFYKIDWWLKIFRTVNFTLLNSPGLIS